MTKIKMLALMAVAALLLLFPAVALGQQIPPHLSAVTANVDGAPASNGTVVTAWIDGSEVGSGEVTDGVAILVISGDASFTGKTISFKIGNLDSKETDTWEQGGHLNPELTISASSEVVAPTAAPTAVVAAAVAPVTGEKGDKGDTGSAGAAGPSGKDGADGNDGAGGSAGPAGSDGAAGPAGSDGTAGSAGTAGEAGGGGSGLAIFALILAIVAIAAAGYSIVMGRRTG
jgi:hypothetical protein